jgi:N-acetyl-1-D-myo-inositol-2-amino-2-deoxy-alpha-D-glucopyranoside deacetylase
MRLLVTVAHPDDEAFGTGGVLAHAAARGVEAIVACATRGELGEVAPGVEVESGTLGAVRERELRDATARLGVARTEVFDWIDSGVDGEPAPGSLAAAPLDDVASAIGALLEEVRPDVVVTLDASDGHRDHAVVRDATLRAIERPSHRPLRTYLWCLPASLMARFTQHPGIGTPDDQITTVVDVSAQLERRWAAIRAHASQTPPYDAMSDELARTFLVTDHLTRVDPPWSGGELEPDWVPLPPAGLA